MKIFIFHTDDYFLKVFSRYLSKENLEYDLTSYSDEEEAEKHLTKETYDLILCELGHLRTMEEEAVYVALTMHTVYPGEDKKASLNIFQKASKVREDLDYMLQVLKGRKTEERKNGMLLLPFFSTEGGAGKTTLAYLTAVECAKQGKTLYMNLEPLAVTDHLYSVGTQAQMESILMAFDNNKEETASVILNAIEKNEDGVYVLPTLNNIGDYLELSASLVLQMLSAISTMTGIEKIILDLPGSFSSFTEEILKESKAIVWVYNAGMLGRKKLEKIQKDPYLKSQGILSKSIYVLNRCEVKNDGEECHAAFPVSKTLTTAKHISKILEVNQAFVTGCQNIVKKAGLQ